MAYKGLASQCQRGCHVKRGVKLGFLFQCQARSAPISARCRVRMTYRDATSSRKQSLLPGSHDAQKQEVESRCDSVVIGTAYMLPALSVAGASLA